MSHHLRSHLHPKICTMMEAIVPLSQKFRLHKETFASVLSCVSISTKSGVCISAALCLHIYIFPPPLSDRVHKDLHQWLALVMAA